MYSVHSLRVSRPAALAARRVQCIQCESFAQPEVNPVALGAPYLEGGSSSTYKTIKSMAMMQPKVLHSILDAVAEAVGDYVGYQIDAGAQCVQIFDSWGGQLPPHMWEVWSKPYIQKVVDKVRATHPGVPLTLYANGSGGLLERMATTGVDCIGLDWTIDMVGESTKETEREEENAKREVVFQETFTLRILLVHCAGRNPRFRSIKNHPESYKI